MATEHITITVDAETARAFREASPADRRKLELLLSLRLREYTDQREALDTVMRDLSQKAQERGLTPEVLEDLLNDAA